MAMLEDSRRNNINCYNNCIYNENCMKESCIMTENAQIIIVSIKIVILQENKTKKSKLQ